MCVCVRACECVWVRACECVCVLVNMCGGFVNAREKKEEE